MRFADILKEFNWVLSVLDSVESKKQLQSARNLYDCWRNKYYNSNQFELYRKFEEEFLNKELSFYKI